MQIKYPPVFNYSERKKTISPIPSTKNVTPYINTEPNFTETRYDLNNEKDPQNNSEIPNFEISQSNINPTSPYRETRIKPIPDQTISYQNGDIIMKLRRKILEQAKRLSDLEMYKSRIEKALNLVCPDIELPFQENQFDLLKDQNQLQMDLYKHSLYY